MKGRLLCLLFIGWGLFVPCAAPVAQGAELARKSPADSHPIEISADRLEAYDAKKVVLFSGNAVATQGDRVIKADKIFLYYKKEERDPGREGLRDVGKTGDLEKIEARGHVSVSQGDRLVTGDQAVYYQESQKIVMTGSAVMQQGNNILRGDKIEVFLNENRGVVEAAENKRVKATIYPVEKK
ncbi:MAG: lipopolysaccharide transport periplasmic protein LptA [Deltaproteobacteria bacterium]|nr:lipopolysaccharide transport periplasmic protein LptA [Deltaproteobacteria bacterium]